LIINSPICLHPITIVTAVRLFYKNYCQIRISRT